MPLRDHFRPPLSLTHPWSGFHSTWATTIAAHLNQRILSERYYALPNVQLGGAIEIDVATVEGNGTSAALSPAGQLAAWSPPAPAATLAVDFSDLDVVEVQVFHDEGGPRLVAAIELVSPRNKDRPASRRAFVIKCAGYLQQGASLIIVDVVTDRKSRLHDSLVELLEVEDAGGNIQVADLNAVSYRIVVKGGQPELQIWPEPLAVGANLPRLPLWLAADGSVPLDLEISYRTACEALRVP